ncbi:peptidase families S8 and S53 domain protein [Synechococcus sp. PCC 7335]|uniref:S8 family serine peptidase n=1 Tax=Synechococcus sp. (strain ATCC 29403 / PCC 7335) TaxID=91464 RepID=UPI00017EC770|nr:S8 family serine peptidase [Synechococcus sp. PCC 7335]EDX86190.1 peptidase families S8 and S53 domain protein [Synechococcus sp. PCC 7335]
MLKRLLPFVLLMTGGFWGATNLSAALKLNLAANAQADVQEITGESDEPEGLYYTFFDERILLDERTDQIAVQFTEESATRGGIDGLTPAYLQLRQDVEAALAETRDISQTPVDIDISPLGNSYALITLPESGTRSLTNNITRQLDQPYVAATLPVVTRQGSNESIVITPEVVVSFAPETTQAEAEEMVSEYGMEMVRPLQFSPGRFLMRATAATGTAILATANQLDSVPGVQSATPNFVQSVAYQRDVNLGEMDFGAPERGEENASEDEPDNDIDEQLSEEKLEETLNEGLEETSNEAADETTDEAVDEASTTSEEVPDATEADESSTRAFAFPNSLLPWQWLLNSFPMRPNADRTDIYALEAWLKSDSGEGVTVAVVDSLLQWDHPDLINSVYRLPSTVSNPLPGEVSGWDFSSDVVTCEVTNSNNCAYGDPDTRISNEEVAVYKQEFQDSVALSDEELLSTYADFDEYLQYQAPESTPTERANYMRFVFQSTPSGEFHGTWSAGVITARPQTNIGLVGVAPNAQFLPVRVFGLNGKITPSALIEASGYAAARGVDVINFSLSSSAPVEEFETMLNDIMRADPNLVIVASAGNLNVNRASFPAGGPNVIAVGSTNIYGGRSFYSSYGQGLDVVAPGGDVSNSLVEGILTTGGAWVSGFWEGLSSGNLEASYSAIDDRGQYVGVQGTSFSAPAVSGIVALMKDADDNDVLTRDQITELLIRSADYNELQISTEEMAEYQQFQEQTGSTISAQEYFFGRGLVNAEVAVDGVRNAVRSVAP